MTNNTRKITLQSPSPQANLQLSRTKKIVVILTSCHTAQVNIGDFFLLRRRFPVGLGWREREVDWQIFIAVPISDRARAGRQDKCQRECPDPAAVWQCAMLRKVYQKVAVFWGHVGHQFCNCFFFLRRLVHMWTMTRVMLMLLVLLVWFVAKYCDCYLLIIFVYSCRLFHRGNLWPKGSHLLQL